MSNLNHGTDAHTDQALEQMLKEASPRPTPSADDEVAVREAVRSEWKQVSGRRKARRQMVSYAIAATVLVGVFALFSVFRSPGIEAVQVATIEKSFGSIYLLGKSAQLRETRDLSNVLSGQTIVTGGDAGIALAWGNGGSVRVDENTRVQFTSDDIVYLLSGRIYFDSTPSALIAGFPADAREGFVVHTDHGDVKHVGTQFMTQSDADVLTVSVREGQVTIDGRYHRHTAASGEQVTLSGRQRQPVLSISRSGEAWSWIGDTSPTADVDGRSLNDFLEWACRELGLELEYEGRAENVARHDAILKGTVDKTPSEALRVWLASAGLGWRIDEGVIYVREKP